MNEKSLDNQPLEMEEKANEGAIDENTLSQQDPSSEEVSLQENLSTPSENLENTDPETSEIDQLKAQIEQLQARNDQLMRVAADFENYQRRVAREREDLIKFAGQQIVTSLLEVLDNMERALQSEVKAEDLPNFVEGIRMIHKQFLDVLQKFGVSVIEAVGQPFNPEYHEAIMSETTNEYPDETVIAEFQKGYQMNGRVLRHSMVKVSKKEA